MDPVLTGALVMACALAGLMFLRFWRTTRDRFFACFAVSFCFAVLVCAIPVRSPGP